ncbi:MAG: pyridoxal phosphate-dependent aminotransferase [Clostridium tyrobutyricum]|jgi:aspartate/methionine/tyrosine aminotransferase|uniref:pyridoxal phosphate-dependent aminotransferase n=1 Tax=Clostridium tyrobutyricum TaxID=1519 RepID=UPI00242DF4B5|nr:pyridoxal phosphate-dependent aminotransferase [Clostridium tyrobutyricum]MCH4199834.1 pyridoxal phosphate-dependent aminotransferase [Clostridium tyrobutyricum]MCH4238052.1 pyridoxal phosphate-dependent aminotransferase [Clostridium tyrobutyricum]MCH4258351.1 pyridoxal phosphate-dependent aminotransferase [Clostridium tyrobutyricum]MCI1239520.1 pyridoxal phosphate-dependent aminotransferase [Clostridium tyrobutyricum]MCI1653233.1 pyridoxal phosphate-dependent aminotransferase [Clostridium 
MEHRFISKRYWKDVTTIMDDDLVKNLKHDDTINLSIGVPDFITPKEIIDRAMKDAENGHTKYTAPIGDPELIEEIVKFYSSEYNFNFEKNEVMTVVGACHGMYLALEAVTDVEDEVIIHEPYFTPYKEQVDLVGCKPVMLKTLEEDDFNINIDRLKSVITKKTKAIILNSPNNPTGACFDRELLGEISKVAIENDLIVISDEVYDAFTYEGEFCPIASIPGMKERTITIGSFSKGYAMTGWRIGHVIAPDFIVNCMKNINENICYSAPSVSQRAALHALRLRKKVQPEMIEEFKNRMFYSYERINGIHGLSVLPIKGGIYNFVNIKGTGMTSNEFAKMLAREVHVIVIPGTSFGKSGEGYVRIACTVGIETLKEAFDRIENILHKKCTGITMSIK